MTAFSCSRPFPCGPSIGEAASLCAGQILLAEIMHSGFKHSWSLLSEEWVLTDAF